MTQPININVEKNRINWVTVLATVGCIIMAFLLWKGCQNSNAQVAAAERVQKEIQRLKKDSIEQDKILLQLKKDTSGTNELIRDLFLTQEFQETELHKRETETMRLARLVKTLRETPDDTIELLNDCSDLADAYFKEKNISVALKAINDSIETTLNKRIDKGDSLINHFRIRYENCMKFNNLIGKETEFFVPRTKFYFGAELAGTKNTIFNQAGLVLSMNTKKDKLYSISTGLLNGEMYGRVNVNFKISFRK